MGLQPTPVKATVLRAMCVCVCDVFAMCVRCVCDVCVCGGGRMCVQACAHGSEWCVLCVRLPVAEPFCHPIVFKVNRAPH